MDLLIYKWVYSDDINITYIQIKIFSPEKKDTVLKK